MKELKHSVVMPRSNALARAQERIKIEVPHLWRDYATVLTPKAKLLELGPQGHHRDWNQMRSINLEMNTK